MFDVRNLRYTLTNMINCEYNHPVLGWIPYTANPDDSEDFGRELYQEIKDRIDIAPYVPPALPDLNAIDLAEINNALAQPGSIVRALGIVTFQEINKLRAKAALPQYTMDQFITALKANIR